MGRYWLAGRLGAGGQGVVYEAYGEAGERVAVKVPRSDSAESRSRLAKEAAAAQRVASFCTARVIEAQVDDAPLYIVSEYVPGPSLREVAAGAGAYEGDALRRLAIGVATALTAIHRAGIVHRDLKPDNIILGPDGPRVIDFGVAREAGPTTTGPIMGTPGYMAPEVLTGRAATEAADVWAWGMVVLFAARGRDAVEAGEPMAVVGRVLEFEADVAGLPEELAPLVSAATARDPAARPAAGDLLLRLLGEGARRDAGDPLARGGLVAGELRGQAGPDLGAIAEELYGELSEDERTAVPEVFLRLLDGDGLRPVEREELPEAKAVDSMLAVFVSAGILAPGGGGYELVAPGLVQAWPRLRDWLAGNREGLPVHRRLAEAAAEWDGHGRKPADLLQGTNLDRTLQWAATERKDLTLAARERDFLDAAAGQARRRTRRRGLIAAVLAVLLVAALGGLGAAEYLRRESARQRDEALARELALRAAGLRELEPALAGLLSVAAWRLAPGLVETAGALYDAGSQHVTDVFVAPYVDAESVQALSTDGHVLASVTDGTARLWDVPTGRKLHELAGLGAGVQSVAVSLDGRLLAARDDKGVRLWDTVTGSRLGGRFASRASGFGALEFDRTGRRLAVPYGSDGEQWWDVATRKPLTAPGGAILNGVSPDGRYGFVADSEDRSQVWDLRRRRRLHLPALPGTGTTVEARFSDDGRALVVVEDVARHDKPKVRLYELPSGTTEYELEGENAQAADLVFDGRYLATWRPADLLALRPRDSLVTALLLPVPEGVTQVRFDLAGKAVRLLNAAGGVSTVDVSPLFDPRLGDELPDLRMSQDGRVLAVKRDDRLELLDPATRRRLAGPIAWKGDGSAMAFSADGTRLAYGDGARVRVLDVASGRETQAVELAGKGAEKADALAFDPGGRTLAVLPSRFEGQLPLELHDLASSRARTTKVTGAGPMDFAPDGSRLLMGGPELRLYDPVGGTVLPVGAEARRVGGAFAYSPDGRQVAFSHPDRITLWDRDLRTMLGAFPTVPGAEQFALPVWSPDGRLIATYEKGPRIRLWDVASRRYVGVVFDAMAESAGDNVWLGFSADGTKLHTLDDDGAFRTHDLDRRHVAATVCARAGRALTAAEWRTYLPGVEPFDVCR
ncbi:serine/threonine-protein kinase [Nonomuraea sp. NPDC001636]|uniref:serine/threonine-protein kinase n=1 Tax=Nonomuraea sp. NPDC001636 TaxID=3154391 RepID=UPI0033205300